MRRSLKSIAARLLVGVVVSAGMSVAAQTPALALPGCDIRAGQTEESFRIVSGVGRIVSGCRDYRVYLQLEARRGTDFQPLKVLEITSVGVDAHLYYNCVSTADYRTAVIGRHRTNSVLDGRVYSNVLRSIVC